MGGLVLIGVIWIIVDLIKAASEPTVYDLVRDKDFCELFDIKAEEESFLD